MRCHPRVLALCLGIAAAVLFIYVHVAFYGFVNFDDRDYVTENPYVRDGLSRQGLQWAFTAFHAGHFHPLTWVSHMLDCQLFGADHRAARGHHLVNVALHAVNSVLLLVVLRRMSRQLWPSALVAVLFAVHPLRVESVAWVTGRKDVLSGLFFLLTLLAYSEYARRPGVARYLLMMVACALGLLAKPILVTIPFVLLLLDVWPLQRLRFEASSAGPSPQQNPQSGHPSRWVIRNPQLHRLLMEKVPLLVLSAGSCLITFQAQRAAGAVSNLQAIPLAWRLVNAPVAYMIYLVKSFWPTNLAFFYPHPALDLNPQFASWLAASLAAALALLLVTFAVVRVASRWPYLVVGWLWYLVMLVPVIGLVQVGMQAWADRFGYLPLIGVYMMVAWTLHALTINSTKVTICVSAMLACGVVVLVLTARRQVAVWKDDRALCENAVAVTNNNFVAHTSLGNALLDLGQTDAAIAQYKHALQLRPDYAEAHNNWGLILIGKGQLKEGRYHLEMAVRLEPRNVDYRLNVGAVLVDLKQSDAAIVHYKEAEQLDPDDAAIYNNWGGALAAQGRFEEAAQQYRRALSLQPDYEAARNNLRWIESRFP